MLTEATLLTADLLKGALLSLVVTAVAVAEGEVGAVGDVRVVLTGALRGSTRESFPCNLFHPHTSSP